MYVCICNAVTEHEIRECACKGATCVEDLTLQLGVGAGCGRCKQCASQLLEEVQDKTMSFAGA